MMIMPRAYQYATMAPPRSPSPGRRRKPCAPPLRPQSASLLPTSVPTPKPKKLDAVSPATPSQPVVIPARSQYGKDRQTKQGRRPGKTQALPAHDPNAISPSMAALLAVTSIPNPRALTSAERRRGKHRELGSLRAEDLRHSVSNSSPKSWSILQAGPEDDGDGDTEKSVDMDNETWSLASDSPSGAFSSFRSLSSDSVPSLLDGDAGRESQKSPSPPTPATLSRLKSRRSRGSSPAVQTIPIPSDSEHPLAVSSFPESPEPSPPPTPTFDRISKRPPPSSSPSGRPGSSFTSNLTASLRLLKSAARTLSAPSRLHDPGSLTIAPSTRPAAVRAKSSPPPLGSGSSAPLFLRSANIDALPLHLSAALPLPVGTVSIQLQPCIASPLSTATATAPPIFFPPSKPAPDSWEKKPAREPRENSDFLRVVVLEMNMRRAGKLSGEGRARIWLGPRQESSSDASCGGEGSSSSSGSKDSDGGVSASCSGPRIADGASSTGAVTLDGEFGEALDGEGEQGEHGKHGTHASQHAEPVRPGVTRRRSAPVPRRWIALEP